MMVMIKLNIVEHPSTFITNVNHQNYYKKFWTISFIIKHSIAWFTFILHLSFQLLSSPSTVKDETWSYTREMFNFFFSSDYRSKFIWNLKLWNFFLIVFKFYAFSKGNFSALSINIWLTIKVIFHQNNSYCLTVTQNWTLSK